MLFITLITGEKLLCIMSNDWASRETHENSDYTAIFTLTVELSYWM